MAEAARLEPNQILPSQTQDALEVYAKSLRTVRKLGACSLDSLQDNPEGHNIKQLAYADFVTSIEENLKTDEDFRQFLDIASWRSNPIINGKVCTANGEPLRAVIERGLQASRLAAEQDTRLEVQVVRDIGDLQVIDEVDAMPVGTARWYVSMEPKEQLQTDTEFWEGMSYREGIVYIQSYAKTDTCVVSGAVSVDLSDEQTWRLVFHENGVEIPADESPNTWIRHGIESQLTPEETMQKVLAMRDRYYELCSESSSALGGAADRRRSVTEYVATRSDLLQTVFKTQYHAVCRAINDKDCNSQVREQAEAMLANSDGYTPKMRRQLIKIVNSQTFDDESGRFMEAAIRYAVVEELRKGLAGYVHEQSVVVPGMAEVRSMNMVAGPAMTTVAAMAAMGVRDSIMELLAGNIQSGARAGRSYGGCAGTFSPGGTTPKSKTTSGDKQNAFGGNDVETAASGEENKDVAECEYVHDGCYCCPYSDEGMLLNYRQKVRAKRDKEGTARCMRPGCNAEMDAAGHAKKGDIYSKALLRQRQKAERTVADLFRASNSTAPKSLDRQPRQPSHVTAGKNALAA